MADAYRMERAAGEIGGAIAGIGSAYGSVVKSRLDRERLDALRAQQDLANAALLAEEFGGAGGYSGLLGGASTGRTRRKKSSTAAPSLVIDPRMAIEMTEQARAQSQAAQEALELERIAARREAEGLREQYIAAPMQEEEAGRTDAIR